ncbi:MAG: hypothetical protein ACRD1R_07805, partial [Acidobacteriota bacterium]
QVRWGVCGFGAYYPSHCLGGGAARREQAGTLDGVVVSFRCRTRRVRPISLKAHAGQGWFTEHRPARQRATYNRRHGVRKLMGAYHVGATRCGVVSRSAG